ncbi:GAF and ANTAR domain-containing protein [Mycolicibacterium arenosum]|uniref:GAF and ANTAR domain-containing protein n=1 Tax=Mycolicibacterium arenosum TaxID=2952157 RepID=A0ABT1M5A3_9MYCO|nr:GAF and ANTAR domain-containing protein [Mycolicibacterium sp. CAU 1645]MCP9272967.1 GAF and ANTAR domain-containing protein [Mycolicibacterium sp. CAU 1645]
MGRRLVYPSPENRGAGAHSTANRRARRLAVRTERRPVCQCASRSSHGPHPQHGNRRAVAPLLGSRIRARGIRSMLSFQLFVTHTTFGALNLYGSETGAFTDDSRRMGEILAQHASVALAASAADDQFRRALSSRDVIGQAKGLLMARNSVSGQQAFAMLLRVSQNTNHKLHDIAGKLVLMHEDDVAEKQPHG